MDRREAELLYELGKEAVIGKLLEMDARIRTLEEQIGVLTPKLASLSTNSTNSSKPPSSDGPQVVRAGKRKSRRSPGGQKGHKGHKRELAPPERVSHFEDLYPPCCEQCSRALAPEVCKESSEPTRHQTFELPKIEPIIIEYRCHELECSCGHRTRAELPGPVAQSQFGPRVHAGVAYLSSVHKASRRGITEIMSALFGLEMSLGSVCNCLERVNPELEPVVGEIRETLPQADNLKIDETTWKCKGDRRTLWVFVSPVVVYFCIALSRGAKVLRSVLGDTFRGAITSDDYSAYHSYHKNGIRQLCWAHLIRKFKGLKESRSSPDAYVFSKHMLREVGHIFGCWHAFREGFLTRQQLADATTLMRARMKKYCLKYQSSPDAQVRTRATRMLNNWDHLFTFLFHDGVDPTNNGAEQALRPAVQWRKLCFGNQSESGERFTERILTVTRTCQLRGKNTFHFLCDLMEAAFKGKPRPSLIH